MAAEAEWDGNFNHVANNRAAWSTREMMFMRKCLKGSMNHRSADAVGRRQAVHSKGHRYRKAKKALFHPHDGTNAKGLFVAQQAKSGPTGQEKRQVRRLFVEREERVNGGGNRLFEFENQGSSLQCLSGELIKTS